MKLGSIIYEAFDKIKNNPLIYHNKSIKSRKDSINYFENKIYSQNGEDGIIEYIFSLIGTTNKFFVEFGVSDGQMCNTRYLFEKKGWYGLMMDTREKNPAYIKKEFVTAKNINILFKKYEVPENFDLLSIDVDGNDYYIWKAISNYNPRVVIIEYNASIPYNESRVIEYYPDFKWDGTDYFGASLLALQKLGKSKGYTLIGCDNNGINAFFVRDELIDSRIKKKPIKKLYRHVGYGKVVNGIHQGHPKSNRKMIEI